MFLGFHSLFFVFFLIFSFHLFPPDADVVYFPLSWPVTGTADTAPYMGMLPLHEYLSDNQVNNSGSHLLEHRQNWRRWVHSHLSLGGIKMQKECLPCCPLGTSLWEESPVLCWQHHAHGPLSWVSSPWPIALWHQDLTLNSLSIVFFHGFVPMHDRCCVSKPALIAFAVHDLGRLITSHP